MSNIAISEVTSEVILKVGQVVQLKLPTAPLMVIQRINESGEVECLWFKGAELQTAKFKSAVLKKF
jgi:uncharacterized protein YodC (DUF2158 family)